MSMQEWQHTARRMVEQGSDLKTLCSHIEALRDSLQKLCGYYRDVPAETAKFTRDPELLAQVQRVADERVALIRNLLNQG